MASMNAPASALNTETSIALSQSMDSVNTTPEEEVSDLVLVVTKCACEERACPLMFVSLSVRRCVSFDVMCWVETEKLIWLLAWWCVEVSTCVCTRKIFPGVLFFSG
ncbi:hypothetical protein C0Q70_03464 [Pomacea canaliculata]|uniref:Uncharacterized protein n=1 Tax=Pomacea canaliculata TaxID=400727 RepID=A0A2T7PSW2_POMCA|nr:hypothetical protein C0Q70_03464 [Pomacea canaliculata]